MKMDLFTKHCAAAIIFASAVTLSSCSDQDFDFDKAHSQNVEANYEQRFSDLFGDINPNQDWDFTDGIFHYGTRAGSPSVTKQSSLYSVESNTITEFKTYLNDGTNHSNLGNAFAMQVPFNDFAIIPIFQGAGGLLFDLYANINGVDYLVWSKNQDMYTIKSGESALTGLTWNSKYIEIRNVGNTNRYLNGNAESTTAGKFALVTYNNNQYLYSFDQQGFLVYDNGLKISRTLTSGAVTFTSGSYLKVGSRYLYNNNGNLGTNNNSSNVNNYKWTYTETNADADQIRQISQLIEGYRLLNQAANNENTETNVTGIRTPWFKFENFNVGDIMYFYLDIKTDNQTYAQLGAHQSSLPSDVYVNGNKASYARHMMIKLDTGDGTHFTIPTNVGTSEDENGNIVQNQVVIIGCEDANRFTTNDRTTSTYEHDIEHKNGGSDWDYNDFAFMIVGYPYVPEDFDVSDDEIVQSVSKRYMVEDMGYSDINSPAVQNGYTDIDFNDIVVDFTKKRTVKYHMYNGKINPEETEYGNWEYESTVRALGGTWDFILYLDKEDGTRVPIFSKSLASDARDAQYPVEFNTSYPYDITTGFKYGIMYNTSRPSDMRGDGHYETTAPATGSTASDESWLCKLKSSNLNLWSPERNNISFVIVENDTDISKWNMQNYFDSHMDSATSTAKGNVYVIDFPSKGACPKIAAFKTNKDWQREKVAVTSTWFSASPGTDVTPSN